jgi:ribosomal protein S18 acetylase RimI-like enzyme
MAAEHNGRSPIPSSPHQHKGAPDVAQSSDETVDFLKVSHLDDFPQWAPRDRVARFFHETMEPYNDSLEDVQAALDYAFVPDRGQGGFLMLVHEDHQLLGALLMLRTGMGGYIPEHILLFVSVLPETRGRGIGGTLIERSIAECDGDVKLHVEHDNPAKRLYERLGFTSDYAEMRFRNR